MEASLTFTHGLPITVKPSTPILKLLILGKHRMVSVLPIHDSDWTMTGPLLGPCKQKVKDGNFWCLSNYKHFSTTLVKMIKLFLHWDLCAFLLSPWYRNQNFWLGLEVLTPWTLSIICIFLALEIDLSSMLILNHRGPAFFCHREPHFTPVNSLERSPEVLYDGWGSKIKAACRCEGWGLGIIAILSSKLQRERDTENRELN